MTIAHNESHEMSPIDAKGSARSATEAGDGRLGRLILLSDEGVLEAFEAQFGGGPAGTGDECGADTFTLVFGGNRQGQEPHGCRPAASDKRAENAA